MPGPLFRHRCARSASVALIAAVLAGAAAPAAAAVYFNRSYSCVGDPPVCAAGPKSPYVATQTSWDAATTQPNCLCACLPSCNTTGPAFFIEGEVQVTGDLEIAAPATVLIDPLATLQIESGTLTVRGVVTVTGELVVKDGATLTLDGGVITLLGGELRVEQGGTLEIQDGMLTVGPGDPAAHVEDGATLEVSGGTVAFAVEDATLQVDGVMTVTGGTFAGGGAGIVRATAGSTLDWSDGAVDGIQQVEILGAESVEFAGVTVSNNSEGGVLDSGSQSSSYSGGCEFSGNAGNALWVANCGGRPTVADCMFHDNLGRALYVSGLNTPILTGNTFGDNAGEAVRIEGAVGTFSDITGNSGTGNGRSGVILAGCTATATTLAHQVDFPWIIGVLSWPYALTVPYGETLGFQPGAVVKFDDVRGHLLVYGTITADQVTFTSLRDDGNGGDTNLGALPGGDPDAGTGALPAPGDWGAITLLGAAPASFTNCRLLYGGYRNLVGAMLYAGGDSVPVEVHDSRFAYSERKGMNVRGRSLVCTGSQFDNNVTDGAYLVDNPQFGDPIEIEGCLFANNGAIGLSHHGLGLPPPRIVGNSFTGNDSIALEIDGTVGSLARVIGNSGSGNGINGIVLQACTASDSLPLQAGFPWVVGSTPPRALTLAAPVTLPPGSVIKFQHRDGLVQANAPLALSGVVFTSRHDDAHGGDTGSDGEALSPARGDWSGVSLGTATASATLDACRFRYGGGPAAAGAMLTCSAQIPLTITHGEFRASAGAGFSGQASEWTFNDNDVTGCAGNGVTVTVGAAGSGDPQMHGNTFTGNGGRAADVTVNRAMSLTEVRDNAGAGNGVSGVVLLGTVQRATTWGATGDFPYVVSPTAPYLGFAAGAPLALEGTVIKFLGAASSLTVNSDLDANGATFTSVRDDSAGGDTNGDGAASLPARGDWSTLHVGPGQASFDGCAIRYGGRGGATMLSLSSPFRFSATACRVRHSAGAGIAGALGVGGATTNQLLVTFCRVDSCSGHGISIGYTGGDSPQIQDNDFRGNAGRAVNLSALNGPSLSPIRRNRGGGNGVNGVVVAGTVGQPTTWGGPGGENLPYVIEASSTLSFTSSAPLTLAGGPGAVIKFMNASSSLSLGAAVSAEAAVFTSLRDDAHGGDTNSDAGATQPAAGDWFQVSLGGSAAASFTGCRFRFGGGPGPDGAMVSSNGLKSLTLAGCELTDSRTRALNGICSELAFNDNLVARSGLHGVTLSIAGSGTGDPALHGNTFESNQGRAVFLTLSRALGLSEVRDNIGSGNKVGGVVLQGPVSRPTIWGATSDFPYIVDSTFPYLSFNSGAPLRLNGTVVKFMGAASSLTLNDSLTAADAVFTALADDGAGGDSNGDGFATLPAPGAWRILDARGRTHVTRSRVSYGGASGASMVQAGLFQPARFDSSLICASATHGVSAGGQLVTLNGCALVEHGSFAAFRSAGTPYVDARTCWWGHASGPRDSSAGPPDYNPAGAGGHVTDYVEYRPWGAVPAVNLPPAPFALLAPAEDDSTPPSPRLAWEEAADPNGDEVGYLLQYSTDAAFASSVTVDVGDATEHRPQAPLADTTRHYWRVRARDPGGLERWSATRSFVVSTVALAADPADPEGAGLGFAIGPLRPNPSAGPVRFELSAPRDGVVLRLEVYDVRGRRVWAAGPRALPAGRHWIEWAGRGSDGRPVAAGVYWLRAATPLGERMFRIARLR